MQAATTRVFVSYSRADAALVAPVVKLLRANRSYVFYDIDDIQPGKRWRGEIDRGLAEAELVVVFWCDHALRSDEVRREWATAIDRNKDLVPLLLDATPLPAALGEFQWIDFRTMVGTTHGSMHAPAGPARVGETTRAAAPMSRRSPAMAGMLAAGIVALVAVVLTATFWTMRPPVETLVESALALVGLLAVLGCVVWLRRSRSKRQERIESAGTQVTEVEQRMASEIQTEIERRVASRHRLQQ